MPRRRLRFTAPDAIVETGLQDIRSQMDIPGVFPPEVLEEARSVDPVVPETDKTDLPLVTIDPPGARDLDQALHIERRANGYRIYYAIADVAAFVVPNGPIDAVARRRGLTLYAPDMRTPLYPPLLSEGLASLLPDETRPAVLWTLDLDEDGALADSAVSRAMVRSRDQLDYPSVQEHLDAGSAPESMRLLVEVGTLRELIEIDRGAVSLPIPDQQVIQADGGWELDYRMALPVERWNAQISLLTGIAAADLMVSANVGLLRTLPPAKQENLEWMHRVARGLEVQWPGGLSYPDLVRSLDARIPAHAALLSEATLLFSGAGYQALPSSAEPREHAALATHYAHATAPLRRLVDRFVSETCLAIDSGSDVPEWVIASLPDLPKTMARARSVSGSYEAACLDLVEAAVLAGRVGQVFDGVVVEIDRSDLRGDVQLREPAVHARVEDSGLTLGAEIAVRLVEASIAERRVVFAKA